MSGENLHNSYLEIGGSHKNMALKFRSKALCDAGEYQRRRQVTGPNSDAEARDGGKRDGFDTRVSPLRKR